MMRGLVIIIMAIDHVRDYFFFAGSGISVSDPAIDAGFYFTRWITHFCAPVFVFLAGTSVGLMSERRPKNELAKFVFKRGLWLIFCEVVIISTALSFSPTGMAPFGGATLAFLQVLFAMGVSMVVLSGALYLGIRNCFIIGAVIMLGHNLLDPIWPMSAPFGDGSEPMWAALHSPTTIILKPFYLVVMYPPLAWVGIMLMGFGSSFIFKKEPAKRDLLLKKIGLSMMAAFVIIRTFGFYGDPNTWQVQELGFISTFFDFMDVTKYPPSLLYFLATMGPMAYLCAYADRFNGWFKDTLVMFGRVPFAFYVGHFYLIHTLAVIFGVYQGFEASQLMTMFPFFPKGYGTGLIGVYLVWMVVLVIMYVFCKWMYRIKSTRKDWWLSYI
jgi:uncharacterized membrane protein